MDMPGFASTSTPSRVRKRVDSRSEITDAALINKRRRMLGETSADEDLISSPIMGITGFTPPSLEGDVFIRPNFPPLSRQSSFTSSRPASPSQRDREAGGDIFTRVLRPSVRRSISSASLAQSEASYSDASAKHFMREPKFLIDYTPPASLAQPPLINPIININLPDPEPVEVPVTADTEPTSPKPLPTVKPCLIACSSSGILFFTRGSRIHFKNIGMNEEVGQLCKMQEKQGEFSAIVCGTGNFPDVVAVGTTKGIVVIYDINTKKRLTIWTGKPVSALAWNGKVLTVGYTTGHICHFNTAAGSVEKMKEKSKTLTRHSTAITNLEWNLDGEFLVSADKKGLVYCWKLAESSPLDVGEFFSRRKKIKHSAAISAATWCPWSPRLLLTADVKGIIRLWNISPYSKLSNAMPNGKLETGAAITGFQWSIQCKEFITTHGDITPADPPPPPPAKRPLHRDLRNPPLPPSPDPVNIPPPVVAHSLAVWQLLSSLRFVTSVNMPTRFKTPIGRCATFAQGMKVVFEVPADRKIHTLEVWGKRKQDLRRHSSLDTMPVIR